jgi:hypothetical protein
VSKETGTLLERAYVDTVYVLGSWACCNSDTVKANVIGRNARATQWHRTNTPASAVDLQRVGREHGEPPRFKKPKDLPWVVELTTDAARLGGQQSVFGGAPAIGFRPIGNILVAGLIFGHENMGDEFGIGIRYDYDAERPDYGGLEFAFGLYDQRTNHFDPAVAGTTIVRELVAVSEFRGRPLQ